ncbi:MAG: hypothetical protein P4N60_22825 [Verrucomicrobiae bacterium]|nr:hypothetical protein [Verrucomicrobiae bacterium]
MNFFWGNVFEYFKDRRLASVFFGTLLALIGVLVAGVIFFQVICAYNFQDYLIYAVPGVALIFVALIGQAMAQARARRRDRYKCSPLSRDELRKARSKLMKAKH